jgi:hypothetical protein
LAPTVGPTRFIYVRSMTFELTNKFLPRSRLVFRSLLFIADKMRDLSLQEPKSWEIIGSATGRFASIPGQVGLAFEARLGHGSTRLVTRFGNMRTPPFGLREKKQGGYHESAHSA